MRALVSKSRNSPASLTSILPFMSDMMQQRGLSTIFLSVRYSQSSRREYTGTVQIARIVIPRLTNCTSAVAGGPCSNTLQSNARQITLQGTNLGTIASKIQVLFRPSGGCSVRNVTNTEVVCDVIGTFAPDQTLYAGVFAREAPEVVSAWISFRAP